VVWDKLRVLPNRFHAAAAAIAGAAGGVSLNVPHGYWRIADLISKLRLLAKPGSPPLNQPLPVVKAPAGMVEPASSAASRSST
jgi:hypothetical protein